MSEMLLGTLRSFGSPPGNSAKTAAHFSTAAATASRGHADAACDVIATPLDWLMTRGLGAEERPGADKIPTQPAMLAAAV
jgi:hypothetical protein